MVERALPLVEQVRQQLLRWIRDDTLETAGGALPSEADIAERLAVSRATVREALARLESDHIVIRRHGSGTYINPSLKEFTTNLEILRDPAALIAASARAASVGQQATRPSLVSEQAAAALDVPAGSAALALSVLYLADAQPAIWMEGLIPVEALGHATPPAYVTLAQFVGQLTRRFITHSLATLEAISARAALARHLEISAGQPVLRLSDVYLTDAGQPTFYSQSYFTPGLIRLQVLRKADGGPQHGRVSVW